MANKQSLPVVNLKGTELQKTVEGVSLINPVRHEHEDINDDIKDIGSFFKTVSASIKHQQKKLQDDEKYLEAEALLHSYRQGLEASQNSDDFEAIAQSADDFIKADFDDKKGKEFWLVHGQNILEANKKDTENLRTIKEAEFGKNLLNQLLFNAQNMIALTNDGTKYLQMGGEHIDQSVFLSDEEKQKYRESFYKNGILNLALQNPHAAEEARVKYFFNDEDLKLQIEKTAALRLKAVEEQNKARVNQEKFDEVKEAVSLWQKKQTGAIDEASYYVLSNGNKETFGLDTRDDKMMPDVTSMYRMFRRFNDGEKLSYEDIYALNGGLMKAYDDGKIDFDEVSFAQNLIFSNHQNSSKGMDKIISASADKILLPDADENSHEADIFMEEKMKWALKIYEAYYEKKNDMIEALKEKGEKLSYAKLYQCAREAKNYVVEMFDLKESKEPLSFSELKKEVDVIYSKKDQSEIWKKFASLAPYSFDKRSLLREVAGEKMRNELLLPRFETWQEVKKAHLAEGTKFYFRGRLAVKA